MPAPAPPNESGRLQALSQYRLLDSDPERSFDDITRLASHIFGTEMSVVSLIDQERQWFKSRVGCEITGTHRDLAFCAYTILEEESLVIEDTLEDARFREHPLVVGKPYIRFYAGVPLINPQGFALGSLCVIHSTPMRIERAKLDSLQALARLVVNEMELRRLSMEWAKSNARVRVLSSMLSMCPACGAVKNNRGEWNLTKDQIPRHFNSLLCPGCALTKNPAAVHAGDFAIPQSG